MSLTCQVKNRITTDSGRFHQGSIRYFTYYNLHAPWPIQTPRAITHQCPHSASTSQQPLNQVSSNESICSGDTSLLHNAYHVTATVRDIAPDYRLNISDL